MYIFQLKEKLTLKDKDNTNISDDKIIINFKGVSGLRLLRDIEKLGLQKVKEETIQKEKEEKEKLKTTEDQKDKIIDIHKMEEDLIENIEKLHGKEAKENFIKFFKEKEKKEISQFDKSIDKYAKQVATECETKKTLSFQDFSKIDNINKSKKDNTEEVKKLLYMNLKMNNTEELAKLSDLIIDNFKTIARFAGKALEEYLIDQIDSVIIEEVVEGIIKKYSISKLISDFSFTR